MIVIAKWAIYQTDVSTKPGVQRYGGAGPSHYRVMVLSLRQPAGKGMGLTLLAPKAVRDEGALPKNALSTTGDRALITFSWIKSCEARVTLLIYSLPSGFLQCSSKIALFWYQVASFSICGLRSEKNKMWGYVLSGRQMFFQNNSIINCTVQ